LKTQ
jgi:small subunit ribosomal protein S25e